MKAINNFVKVIVFVILGLALACGLCSCSGIGGSFGEEPEVEINCPNSVHEYVAIVDASCYYGDDDYNKWETLHVGLNKEGYLAYKHDTARVKQAQLNYYTQSGFGKVKLVIEFKQTSLKMADMEKALKSALSGYNYDRFEVNDTDSEAQPEVEALSEIYVKVSPINDHDYDNMNSIRNVDVREFEEWFSSQVDEVTYSGNNWYSYDDSWYSHNYKYEYNAQFTDGFKELYPRENLENIESDILAWFAERGVNEDCVKITFGQVYFYK